MSDLLIVPLLALHLVCVNIASAGPLVAVWLEYCAARGNQDAKSLGPFLSWAATVLLVVGGGVGLLIGYLKWDSSYQTLLGAFERRIFFGSWEILFSLVLMFVSSIWWSWRPESRRLERWIRGCLLVFASTNLLYHFPFLFVVLSDASKGSLALPDQPVDGAQFRQLIATFSVISRVVHIWIASFAVTGTAFLARTLWRRPDTSTSPDWAAVWGARIALVATVLQLPVGLWILLQLPRGAQLSIMGSDPLAGCLLVASIVLSLTLLQQLAAVSFGDTERQTLRKAVASMLLIVLLMTAVLQRI